MRLGRIGWLLAAMALLAYRTAEGQDRVTARGEVATWGMAERWVRPDLAVVVLQLSSPGSTPKEAGQRLTSRADSVRRALTAIGIPRDSLVTAIRSDGQQNRIEARPGAQRCRPRAADPRNCDPVI